MLSHEGIDDGPGSLDAGQVARATRHGGMEPVQVDELYAGHLRDRRVDITRHGDVEEEQRLSRRAVRDRRRFYQRSGGARRGDDEVGVGQ